MSAFMDHCHTKLHHTPAREVLLPIILQGCLMDNVVPACSMGYCERCRRILQADHRFACCRVTEGSQSLLEVKGACVVH